MELGERLDRLWAALIDRLIIVPVGIGAAVAIPALRNSPAQAPAVVLTGLLVVGFVAYQLFLLTTEGQTIGKKAMGLRIVLVKDLSNGGFVTNVLLRGGVGWVISMVPVVGMAYGLGDPLCIFRDDRRCLHDHIAGTCVIKVNKGG
jgi:uncharacterized RDD family membrane protein YckC